MLGPWGGAKQQEQPRALQVRQTRQLLQQRPLGFQTSQGALGNELGAADWGAKRDEAALLGRATCAPHVVPKLLDAGGRGPIGRAVNAGFALVGSHAGVEFHRVGHQVVSLARALGPRDDV